ncbi:MAG TPA: PTS sugar transporter subunit IIA [Phycisphaerae bacterium]|nr:PTS sugar transporter subunit IIA [Phycisphaerae bacterium]
MLELSSYLTPQQIILSHYNTKKEVLTELATMLAEQLKYDAAAMVNAVFEREGLMSTGIGHGLAVPHVRLEGLAEPALAVSVQPAGISDYESLDSMPVAVIVLIAAPAGQHEMYIRLLAQVADVLKRDELREKVIAAATRGEADTVFKILTGK